ncbi:peroxisomal multifunctional enzyme type 2-like [Photinus pyralis]|uniref:peroxisomal multifunctional enzyme type 2-like n=1 Tax=Photinus pyralis TaxID=7054 RepID=UPI0012677551|nr:peroxisomal multifunctional enzyme type 2-like [Photinus pyralis]XP_031351686.1 peroxisomal multifunctional enzyme type 2-like [Photinus pyralis]
MSKIRFDGSVAVITGTNAGFGQPYALLFASRCSKVVINDMDDDLHGPSTGYKAADVVDKEIKEAGCTTVANYVSVSEVAKIIKTALDTYGRIDILVNNAGILRDRSFVDLSEDDWDVIQIGHLKGSFKIPQSAFRVMKKQGYGRVTITSSGSSLSGSFATNRLTQDILPEELYQDLKSELNVPVNYLCHESCQENGSILESSGCSTGKLQICRSKGEEKPTPFRETDIFTFSSKDIVLYALGVGASLQNEEDRNLLYENHHSFRAIPSFYILPGNQATIPFLLTQTINGTKLSFENSLHGEQYLEIYESLPEAGTLLSIPKKVEVLDKGSGALVVVESNCYNEQDAIIMRNQYVLFAVGAGNFGGPRTSKHIVPCLPKPARKPDLSLTYKTTIDQAALYRLSGDFNPIHIDPNFSTLVGYDKPILHGLCTLGISVRLIMGAFASNDPELFRAVKARFAGVVEPSQTLIVHMWRSGNRVHFETVVVENDTAAIIGAYVDLKAISRNE